jgi:anion-transporting  ArsA/GET3 family ATPase
VPDLPHDRDRPSGDPGDSPIPARQGDSPAAASQGDSPAPADNPNRPRPAAPHLVDLRLVFVTGKGGTGKTTVAAALAHLAAGQGKRVLVCEVDAKGDLAARFEAAPTEFVEREVAPGIWAMSMDTEASLREYLKLHLRIPVVGRIGPLAHAFDFVATAAPGVREILTVGKLCYEVREGHYDLVVVDAPATGHVIGQLAAPQAINSLVKVGLIRSQTDWMLDILSDPGRTGLIAVTTPEEMPVTETLELSRRVAEETTVRLSAVVVNRVLPELFSRSEEVVFESLRDPARASLLAGAAGGDVAPVLEGARLAVTMRRTRAGHLDHLREQLDPSVPVLLLPYLFTRTHGRRTTRQVAASLGEELGF